MHEDLGLAPKNHKEMGKFAFIKTMEYRRRMIAWTNFYIRNCVLEHAARANAKNTFLHDWERASRSGRYCFHFCC